MNTIVKNSKKPHILCEYCHVAGSDPGDLKEYQELFYTHDELQGDFIWEQSSHDVEPVTDSGEVYYRYDGDFGDDLSNKDFCIDGTLTPGRTLSPSLCEYEKVIEPITTSAIDVLSGEFSLLSRFDFENLAIFKLIYTVTEDQTVAQSGTTAAPVIVARTEGRLRLPYHSDPPKEAGAAYYLTLSHQLKETTAYVSAGHELATARSRLPIATPGIEITPVGPLTAEEVGPHLHIEEPNFSINFDKVKGALASVIRDGRKLLHKGLKFAFWWAPISSDMEIIGEIKKKYFLHLEHEIARSSKWKEVDDFTQAIVKTVNGTANSVWHY